MIRKFKVEVDISVDDKDKDLEVHLKEEELEGNYKGYIADELSWCRQNFKYINIISIKEKKE